MAMESSKSYGQRVRPISPFGLPKNDSFMTPGNDRSAPSHEEEFFKIKADRLEAELAQVKEENLRLRAKATDFSATNQMLKERIIVLEN